MIELNPFTGEGACKFRAVANKSKKTGLFMLSQISQLQHSHDCPVAGGHVKSRMLETSTGFRVSMEAHGFKTSVKVLQKEAAKIGYGGDGVSPHTLFRLQRKHRNNANEAYEKQFQEMPRYLKKLEESGNALVKLSIDDEDVFEYAVVAFPAVCEALRIGGRPVASTDFGHMKHDLFGGLNATGMFQLGDGRLVAPWAAIFREKNESNYLWKVCAEAVKEFGIDDLYKGAVHYRDRHPGADAFESILGIEFKE